MRLVIMLGIAARFLIKYMVTKVMLMLGIGFVTFTGIDTLVEDLGIMIESNYAGLPNLAWSLATLCGLDVAITIILSALALALAMRFLSAGTRMLTSFGR